VHPAKLAVDWGTGLASTWLFWDQKVAAALLVGFIPSILVSLYLVFRTDLSRYRDTPLGRYFLSPLTRPGDSLRLFGLLVMWAGGWYTSLPAVFAGLAVIVLAWVKGLFVKKRGAAPPRSNP
jgi:hypothetical protein